MHALNSVCNATIMPAHAIECVTDTWTRLLLPETRLGRDCLLLQRHIGNTLEFHQFPNMNRVMQKNDDEVNAGLSSMQRNGNH